MLVHILAILAALVWSFVVGFVWYGPLFGKAWSSYTKIKQNDKTMKANMKKYMLQNQIVSFISILVLSVLITVSDFHGVLDIFVFIMLSWLVFSVPAVMAPNIWEKKALGLGMINIFANLASLMVSAMILFLIIG